MFMKEVWPRNSFRVFPDFRPWILQEGGFFTLIPSHSNPQITQLQTMDPTGGRFLYPHTQPFQSPDYPTSDHGSYRREVSLPSYPAIPILRFLSLGVYLPFYKCYQDETRNGGLVKGCTSYSLGGTCRCTRMNIVIEDPRLFLPITIPVRRSA